MRLVLQYSDPAFQPSAYATMSGIRRILEPSLVDFALPVHNEIVLSFKPFRAFNAVPLTQAWEVLWGSCRVILRKVLLARKICLDLVKISK